MAVLRTTLAMVLAVLASWCAVSWCATTPAARAAAPVGAPAADCETLDLSDADAVREHADAVTDVFAGPVRTVRARTSERDGGPGTRGDDAPRQDPDSGVRRYDHTVDVKRTFRGDLEFNQQVRVVTRPRTTEDGFGKLAAGRWYLFFVSAEKGQTALVATCESGTQALMRGLSADQEAALEDALAEPEEEMPEVSLTAPADGAGDAPSFGRLAAPGAALVLIGVLGLLLLMRVGSSRRV